MSATGADADTLARPLDDAVRARNAALLDLDGTIQSGFQLAASRGPLCEEPMMGVCFVVVNAQVTPIEGAGAHGPLSGQMITCVRDACRSAFLSKGTFFWREMIRLYPMLIPRSPSGALVRSHLRLRRANI